MRERRSFRIGPGHARRTASKFSEQKKRNIFLEKNLVKTRENYSFHCFWLETRLQRSLTCSASARMLAFHSAAPTHLLWTDEGAAISTKSTRGCGGLGAASPALGACRSIRLRRGRMLSAMRGTSVQPRQNGLARRFQPDSK